jgi:hypothetical protein
VSESQLYETSFRLKNHFVQTYVQPTDIYLAFVWCAASYCHDIYRDDTTCIEPSRQLTCLFLSRANFGIAYEFWQDIRAGLLLFALPFLSYSAKWLDKRSAIVSHDHCSRPLSPVNLSPSSHLLAPYTCLLLPAACLLPPDYLLLPLSTFHLPVSSFLLPPSSFLLPPSSFLLPPSSFLLSPAFSLLPPPPFYLSPPPPSSLYHHLKTDFCV